ncbi:TonB-dependent receptor domain-containing protein [Novosphingobium sp.]|uniref:TonB-dependent receptor domain-containing protein n=1 Tax=Novosphingobium sp. TaxID=1874826 RepID=UPI00286E3EC7|nr:TonB-dependent receptor [Novosphingobium sp.]
MNFNRKTVLRLEIAALPLALASMFAPSAAWAQNTAAPAACEDTDTNGVCDSEETGTIIVTGSRIPRPETDGVIAGVQIDSRKIEERGFTNTLEALNDIPLVGPGASPLTGNNGGQTASLGSAFPDLLDLGTQRTLTLVNGRRFVSGNPGSLFVEGNATGAQVDVNVIPSTLIKRVDVLTVGGASAYGADAIAGVVNFILRDDFDGLTVRALSGISERGDTGQTQIAATYGLNFAEGRGNIVISGEYSHNDGLQADTRDFRLARTNSYTNPFNGAIRNTAFSSAIIDVNGLNNGAFLRSADDGQAGTLFGEGFINQSLSFNGTVTNPITTPYSSATAYTPITNAAGTITSNFISFRNGLAPVGVVVPGVTGTGATSLFSSRNVGFYGTAGQIIQGTPGVGYAGTALVNGTTYTLAANGLNGATTSPLAITTFAPTALPTGVTATQVFTQFGITPPTGATAGQLTTLAVNVLQANRSTAREFFAANPNVNVNYLIGTFVPSVPKIANTDTSLVTVRINQAGGTAQVPVNQVLPFVAVPLEFNTDGSLRTYNLASGVGPNTPLTMGQATGSNGGFGRSIENVVLRTQQDRYIANLIGHYDLTENLTFFTENMYARVNNRSNRNSPSQNFQSSTAENAPLIIDVRTNPYLTAQNKGVLSSVGINGTTDANSSFILTRQNQDIFGENAFTTRNETFRLLGGLKYNFEMFGKEWNAEVSGTYGKAITNVRATQINDIEYQLALDAVDAGQATTGVANGNIVCRASLFPSQYLGKSPVGVAANIVRQKNGAGELVETLFTPTITQSMIDGCKPLNPFGYNNMTAAAKAYVSQEQVFRNVGVQTLFTASFGGGLFDLPAGPLAVSFNGEYRKDELRFSSNPLNQLGRGRAAPSSNFGAFTETWEGGAEARIPLTGPDFLSFMGDLVFNPAIRVTKMSGAADEYRNTAGVKISPKASGKAQTIYSLAGTWKPIRDISFRGNYTQSVRQPSVVELFLGGQPVFTTPTDYCSPGNLTAAAPTVRRANCRSAVIASNLATDATTADAFLATFTPLGVGLSGTYAGNPGLQPERANSWTVGGTLTPRFVPGLSISADYISVDLKNTIVPTSLAQGIQSCYDSPTYPDTTAQTGNNLCSSFTRDASFQIANGYNLSFLNLGSIKVRALNISASYPIDLGKLGSLSLSGNAYHLLRFESAASGDFALDGLRSDGTFSRPKWEIQGRARYEKDGFYLVGTWNHRSPTHIFSSGAIAGPEVVNLNRYPAIDLFDAAIGYDVNDKFRIQLSATNLTDVNYAGELGYLFQDYVDQIGRRFQVTVIAKF